MGMFDDLIPKQESSSTGLFDDLIPVQAAKPTQAKPTPQQIERAASVTAPP